MPIMDGYKATYTIRNAQPFVHNPDMQGTPIVAMTASAIQGDKEKCQAAGMDDYLAKPVKKPNLEKMLVKWAIEGKKKRAELKKNPHLMRTPKRPDNPRHGSSFTSSATSEVPSQELLSSELDKLEVYARTLESQAESTADRADRQQRAEEQAIVLRDHELIEAGEDPKTKLGRGLSDESSPAKPEEPVAALTKENMERFAKSDRVAKLKREGSGLQDEDDSSAMATVADTAKIETASMAVNRSNAPSPSPGGLSEPTRHIHRRSQHGSN